MQAQQLKVLRDATYSLNSADASSYSGHLRGSTIERGIRKMKRTIGGMKKRRNRPSVAVINRHRGNGDVR